VKQQQVQQVQDPQQQQQQQVVLLRVLGLQLPRLQPAGL
jgi:hypothetical protein